MVGALTTLAVQAVGPFLQQIISHDYQLTSTQAGSLPVANNVGSNYTLVSSLVPGVLGPYIDPVDMPTSAAFYGSIFSTEIRRL